MAASAAADGPVEAGVGGPVEAAAVADGGAVVQAAAGTAAAAVVRGGKKVGHGFSRIGKNKEKKPRIKSRLFLFR